MFSANTTQVGTPTEGVPYTEGYVGPGASSYPGTGSNGTGATGVGAPTKNIQTSVASVWGIATSNGGSFQAPSAYNIYIIKQDGTFWAAGHNQYGQLGYGITETPVTNKLLTLQRVRDGNTWALVAGGYSNIATKTDGTLWSCGSNIYGQLGISTTVSKSSPVQIGGLTDWPTSGEGKFIGTGDYFLVIKSNNTLWAWGYNVYGMYGDSKTYRSSPVQMGSAEWAYVAANRYNAMAIKTNGTLWALGGQNGSGELGLNDTIARSSSVQVGSDTNWSKVYLGSDRTIAIKTDGTLWTWGNNNNGQLGIGTIISKSSPTQVGAGTGWKYGRDAQDTTFFFKTDGTLWACGSNTYGFNFDPAWTAKSSPTQIGSFNNAIDITSCIADNYEATRTSLVIKSDTGANISSKGSYGTPSIYSYNYALAPMPILLETTTKWKQVTSGVSGGGGVSSDGTLWTWGNNTYGTLGNGTVVASATPIKIGLLTNWKQYARNYNTSGAIKTDGTLWTWGTGWLGNSTAYTANRSSPIQIGALTNWKQLATSDGSGDGSEGWFLSVKTDGTMWGWGFNGSGQLGTTNVITYSSPVQIGALTNWSSVATGGEGVLAFSLAVKSNGTLWAWGNNTYGQLGLSSGNNNSSPVQIGAGTSWASVSCGAWSVLAVKTDGTLWAWGRNNSGQLGLGDIVDRSSPVQVGAGTSWASCFTGQLNTSFAIKTDGTMWGFGAYPGDGSYNNNSSPVQISSGTTGGRTTWLGLSNSAKAYDSTALKA